MSSVLLAKRKGLEKTMKKAAALEREIRDLKKTGPARMDYERIVDNLARLLAGFVVPKYGVDEGFNISFDIVIDEGDIYPLIQGVLICDGTKNRTVNALARFFNVDLSYCEGGFDSLLDSASNSPQYKYVVSKTEEIGRELDLWESTFDWKDMNQLIRDANVRKRKEKYKRVVLTKAPSKVNKW
jgi:hypothetical protein